MHRRTPGLSPQQNQREQRTHRTVARGSPQGRRSGAVPRATVAATTLRHAAVITAIVVAIVVAIVAIVATATASGGRRTTSVKGRNAAAAARTSRGRCPSPSTRPDAVCRLAVCTALRRSAWAPVHRRRHACSRSRARAP